MKISKVAENTKSYTAHGSTIYVHQLQFDGDPKTYESHQKTAVSKYKVGQELQDALVSVTTDTYGNHKLKVNKEQSGTPTTSAVSVQPIGNVGVTPQGLVSHRRWLDIFSLIYASAPDLETAIKSTDKVYNHIQSLA